MEVLKGGRGGQSLLVSATAQNLRGPTQILGLPVPQELTPKRVDGLTFQESFGVGWEDVLGATHRLLSLSSVFLPVSFPGPASASSSSKQAEGA